MDYIFLIFLKFLFYLPFIIQLINNIIKYKMPFFFFFHSLTFLIFTPPIDDIKCTNFYFLLISYLLIRKINVNICFIFNPPIDVLMIYINRSPSNSSYSIMPLNLSRNDLRRLHHDHRPLRLPRRT